MAEAPICDPRASPEIKLLEIVHWLEVAEPLIRHALTSHQAQTGHGGHPAHLENPSISDASAIAQVQQMELRETKPGEFPQASVGDPRLHHRVPVREEQHAEIRARGEGRNILIRHAADAQSPMSLIQSEHRGAGIGNRRVITAAGNNAGKEHTCRRRQPKLLFHARKLPASPHISRGDSRRLAMKKLHQMPDSQNEFGKRVEFDVFKRTTCKP
jgi:hypothetical protein